MHGPEATGRVSQLRVMLRYQLIPPAKLLRLKAATKTCRSSSD